MSYQIYQTDKAGLAQFYETIIGKNETYAPVLNFEKYEYKKVSKLEECEPESPIALTMSMKPLFFPKNTEILKYKESKDGMEIIPDAVDEYAKPKVVIGVKHCDARALQVLDKVYQWDYHDEDFRKRRENTLVISTRCEKAGAHCFCTSLDYDVENSDAYDVMVVKAADGNYYLQAHTSKGDAFLKDNAGKLTININGCAEKIKEQYAAFAASFALKMNYEEVNKRMHDQFDSPEYEKATSNCISCNTCSFVCPTCHCFKVSDEKIKDIGIRYKAYDSCNSPYFTLMAGGHNPRPVKYRRWRQRAMHKFVYYKERFGVNLCVGCGKCAISCPVNIHIFDVVNQVANKA